MLAKLKPYAKSVVATLGLIAQAINVWVPQYSGEAKSIVATIIGALVLAGVYKAKNARSH